MVSIGGKGADCSDVASCIRYEQSLQQLCKFELINYRWYILIFMTSVISIQQPISAAIAASFAATTLQRNTNLMENVVSICVIKITT